MLHCVHKNFPSVWKKALNTANTCIYTISTINEDFVVTTNKFYDSFRLGRSNTWYWCAIDVEVHDKYLFYFSWK